MSFCCHNADVACVLESLLLVIIQQSFSDETNSAAVACLKAMPLSCGPSALKKNNASPTSFDFNQNSNKTQSNHVWKIDAAFDDNYY